jgi:Protein of unknown function (DUF3551)
MRKSVIAGLALWAAFAAFAGKTHADVNYPWCLMGDTRGYECVFSTREQCMQDGRNRGFGSQCIQNPYYKPGAPTVSGEKRTVSQISRPSQAVSAARQRKCSVAYVGGPVAETCNGWYNIPSPGRDAHPSATATIPWNTSPCPSAWRYVCSR